jgi:hypothetical protein
MSFKGLTLWFFRLLLLIGLFDHFEHLICETLELVTVPDLVLFLGMENASEIHEAFKFTQPGLVLLIAMRPLYIVHGTIRLPLLVVALG